MGQSGVAFFLTHYVYATCPHFRGSRFKNAYRQAAGKLPAESFGTRRVLPTALPFAVKLDIGGVKVLPIVPQLWIRVGPDVGESAVALSPKELVRVPEAGASESPLG